jgi:hypothetical protein
MAGLVPAIHVFGCKTWMADTSVYEAGHDDVFSDVVISAVGALRRQRSSV